MLGRKTVAARTQDEGCRRIGLWVVVLMTAGLNASSFDPPEDAAGPLKVTIEGPKVLEQRQGPFTVDLVLENRGTEELSGTARCEGIDGWLVEPSGPVSFTLAGNGTSRLPFTVTLGEVVYNAHYPIHGFVEFELGGGRYTLHPILVLETRLPLPPAPSPDLEWQPYPVARDSMLGVWYLPVRRSLILVEGGEAGVSPVGWQGSEPGTGAYFRADVEIDRQGIKRALAMHPPWREGVSGPIVVEYPLNLPESTPIMLEFANAIRDNFLERGEPPSDGVTFRVRVASSEAPAGDLGTVVFQRHTAAKVWEPGQVDLSEFAGKSVRLQLESHPGPDNNTTCDQSYWAEPTLRAGGPQATFPTGQAGHDLGVLEQEDGRFRVTITPGSRGLLDSAIEFHSKERRLQFSGFEARVFGYALHDPRSPTSLEQVRVELQRPKGRYRVRHRFQSLEGPFDLLGELRVERGALLARFWLEDTPPPRPWRVAYLEDLATGPWSTTVRRVYAGAGNVIEKPAAFRLHFDGHALATSFVGFDFEDSFSMVQAVDAVPDFLAVSPSARHYSLHTPHSQTMVLIPASNVWDAVRTFRDIDPRDAAPGVPGLAGRFVFDLWGGTYGESAEALDRAFRYGLRDAVVVWHNWQRWGYDYRLPDIYPPNPRFGSHEAFLRLVQVCKDHGVLLAPHDNYIDFYPDAEQFTYDRVAFYADGTPQRGWENRGRNAQSYRFRPDRLRPFVERNLRLIRDGFAPTAYFIDVWSSAGPYDFWTRDGQFCSRLETREIWGETFAWIRRFLGNNAPQISESGHDQLIGWLDGAQANHLRWGYPAVGPHGRLFWDIEAADGERIPWFDAAYHDRFILHGAGYEPRFCSGLDPRLHGMYSDDYITTEVLTGHPAMVDRPFSRSVLAKYWLLQELQRALALRIIDSVDFVNDDLHSQHVLWTGGGETWVNRGREDWEVNGHVLPQYGFYARVPGIAGNTEAAIERLDGVIVDWSRSPRMVYVNARPVLGQVVAVRVELASIGFSPDRTIEVVLRWQVAEPLEGDYRVFVHFVEETGAIKFQGDFDPEPPTALWRPGPDGPAVIETTTRVPIPEKCVAGQSFRLRVGLYSAPTVQRLPIDGFTDGHDAAQLGSLTLRGTKDSLEEIEWKPFQDPAHLTFLQRLNRENRIVEFGPVATDGACKLEIQGDALIITPLPEGREFALHIHWDALPWPLPRPSTLEALSETGDILVRGSPSWEGDTMRLSCQPGVFFYRLLPNAGP